MNPDRVHPEARFEFLEAIRFYNKRSSGLGEQFSREIKNAIDVIDQNPECGSLSDVKGLRSLRVRRFPYVIVFDGTKAPPFIAAIYHERRRPNAWKHRLS